MKCPHCGEDFEPTKCDYRSQHGVLYWNYLAEKYDLRTIREMGQTRRSHLKKRLEENPGGYWTSLEKAIKQRGAWARKKKFPTFDQAVAPAFLQKLLEGNYDGEPGEEDPERTVIIALLQSRRFGDTVATTEGLEGSRGVERWHNISIERLRRMRDVSRTGV